MSNDYTPPIRVFIPVPTETPKASGIFSTAHYGGNLRVRLSNEDYNFVQEEAEELGLSISGFSRSVIMNAARALRKHRKENSTSDSTGE